VAIGVLVECLARARVVKEPLSVVFTGDEVEDSNRGGVFSVTGVVLLHSSWLVRIISVVYVPTFSEAILRVTV